MTTTTLNVELLNKVLDLIDTKPEKWNQNSWIGGEVTDDVRDDFEAGRYTECGTTACVAGWAVVLSDTWKPRRSYGDEIGSFLTPGGQIEHSARDQGEDLLGLDHWQATYVFMDMPFNEDAPHTFTDQVRVFLDLDPKWGTEVMFKSKHDVWDDSRVWQMLLSKPADGEEVDYAGEWSG